ncbi:hypothetical protein AALP_AA1G120100 [Arabis alpina]|uniref:GOST seven transmembrane domain-containing protein n=1 Tax=Arabis alpina TaxID=50452 RepID=A0A087HMP0_ARAAL|nr:hypothetical protein AALP_AA1G120100 [Arabis alpina]
MARYKSQGFTKLADASYFHGGSEGLYATRFLNVPGSSPDTPLPLKGKSFIRFEDVSFLRTKESAIKQNSTQSSAGLVEAILFVAKQQDRIGRSLLKTENMCCTQALADAGSCNLGEVIISADPNDPHQGPKRIHTFFKSGEQEVKMSLEAVAINRTGWYTVYFMTCDPELDGTIIRGRTVWKNLDGYLPGDQAHLMNFYGFMFLAYVVLGLVWFPQVFRYRRGGIHFQNQISLLISVSIYELAFLYYDFAYLNSAGSSPTDVTFCVVTLSSARKAVSRLLLLFLSSGYGIIKPTFDRITLRMLLAGVLCFVISEALGLAMHFGNIPENGMTFLALSWAILETCFIQWIFRSLFETLKNLKVNKRNIAKLQLYKKFARVLVTMVVLNIFWIYVEVYAFKYLSLSELWHVTWIIPTVWYLLSYALLVFICFSWAPTEKPTRYLYIAEMEDEFEEADEELSLIESGEKTEDGDAERRTLLDAFIIFFGNIPRGRHENPT